MGKPVEIVSGQQYERSKQYPNVPMNAIKAGLGVAAGLVLLHAGVPLVDHTFLADIPTVSFFTDTLNTVGSAASNTLAGLVHNIPGAHAAPDALFGNSHVNDVLTNVPFGHDIIKANDIVTGETAAAIALIPNLRKANKVRKEKPQILTAPDDATLAAADEVIAAAQKWASNPVRRALHPRSLVKRYNNLNKLDVALEIEGTVKDLRKADISKTAVFARPVAGLMNLALDGRNLYKPGSKEAAQKAAAFITLEKEVYNRLPGNVIHGITSGLLDGAAARIIQRLPVGGDALGFVADITTEVVRKVLPKKDMLGQKHHARSGLWLDVAAIGIGAAPFIPFTTSEDIKEAVEIVARPALQNVKDAQMNAAVNQAAKEITSGKVNVSPRRFTTTPRIARA